MVDFLGLDDWPGTWDNGTVTNNTNFKGDITVVDMDNRTVCKLDGGKTSDNETDSDFTVYGGNYTKIGPNNIAINEDGSYLQIGNDYFPGNNPRPANLVEINQVNEIMANPSNPNGSGCSSSGPGEIGGVSGADLGKGAEAW